ncbi:MAG: iron-sulfur cluster assembly protein IscA [Gammaproteobacteria bacterium]|nr:iron-sulfur cluster assembly protein IscA [Gammaproteobacteria bacterium]
MNPKKHKPELLNFTTKALAHFKHMVSMQGKENKVKLGVKKMGCNGYAYFFEFTSRSNKSDHRVCVDDIDFYIPSDSVEIIKGSQVDFTIEGLNQGIKFINPNASAVCGCGESFTVRDEEFSTEATSAQKKIKNIAT